MRVIQVVPRVAAQSSGPSHSVTRLCRALQAAGAGPELHVLEPLPEAPSDYPRHAYACARWPGAWRLGWSPAMRRGLAQAAQGAAIVHNHSMWMMPNIYSFEAARAGGCKYVFSPRGTLSQWALGRSPLRKKAVWWYGQKAALEGADCLHATSEKEFDEMRTAGLSQPVAVIPNGVGIPEALNDLQGSSGHRSLVFLGRLHPVKNVDQLLGAWQRLQAPFPDWRLVIAGPAVDDYARAMRRLAVELRLERVEFMGEVAGAQKQDLLAGAELFVLPTRTENFGLAVAEALAHGTPVVVTQGAPWAGVEAQGCGWWIEPGQPALTAALAHAMAQSTAELAAMGQRGRAWMARDFAWPAIGERMTRTYQWLMGAAERPEWVHA